MGDQISIPRSYSGKIGVADVNNSIKRTHSLKLLQATNSTTGQFLGNSTTAPALFARNVTLEKVIYSFWLQSTATTGTTLLQFSVMDGATTLYVSPYLNDTTQLVTTGWYEGESGDATKLDGSLSVTAGTSSSKIWVYIPNNSPAAQVKKLNIWLRYREAVDS